MAYDPAKHHRRSIRLQGYDYASPGAYFITICTHHRERLFGDVVNGDMQLNQFGQIVQRHWALLSNHHRHVRVDEFIVMPDHVHGILILEHPADPPVGAGLGNTLSAESTSLLAKPAPTGGISSHIKRHGVPEIIRGFKTFSARRINQIRKTRGTPVWQRNYYEHIIHNDRAMQRIRRYIRNNPSAIATITKFGTKAKCPPSSSR